MDDGEIVEDSELEAEEVDEEKSVSEKSFSEKPEEDDSDSGSSWLDGVKATVKSAVDCCKEM